MARRCCVSAPAATVAAAADAAGYRQFAD